MITKFEPMRRNAQEQIAAEAGHSGTYIASGNQRNPSMYTSGVYTTTATAASRTGARARARDDEEAPIPWEDVYMDAFGRTPSRLDRRDVEHYICMGMCEEVVTEAIRAAMDAPRPTWRYAMAVLRRCADEGVYTIAAFMRRSEVYNQRRGSRTNRVRAQEYSQRDYTKGELEALCEKI